MSAWWTDSWSHVNSIVLIVCEIEIEHVCNIHFAYVGAAVGYCVGCFDGYFVGDLDGISVGAGVGLCVIISGCFNGKSNVTLSNLWDVTVLPVILNELLLVPGMREPNTTYS